MTNLSTFTEDELELIFEAPGAVADAAVYADGRPGPGRLFKQSAVGAKAFQWGLQDENEFLRAMSAQRLEKLRADAAAKRDEPKPDLPDPYDEDGNVRKRDAYPVDSAGKATTALELTGAALALLRERLPATDAAAYGAWLVQIATRVTDAGGTKKGVFGKRTATDAEQDFLGRLLVAVEG
ncbi:hypothetical protein [Promicromonospora sp. NPDC023987]|uniref:hypothetical protein n=1 Tax=Promicromonospora sp. NPDC023987 TaxID=3155360 RepID=UPI0033EB0141